MNTHVIPLQGKRQKSSSRYGRPCWKQANGSFTCLHCRGLVASESDLSGVQNRNHCPYCLWSRHLDLYRPGDRLSACKSGMRPIGLTTKIVHKKYGPTRGELMLIHICEGCGHLSINRVAADDVPEMLLAALEASTGMDQSMRGRLESCGIQPLETADQQTVRFQLFGYEAGSGRI